MKLFKSNCTKKIILVFNLALVILLSGCEKKYSELTLQQELISNIEKRQGFKVACIEEVAFQKKFISAEQFSQVIERTPNSSYKEYLKMVLRENNK